MKQFKKTGLKRENIAEKCLSGNVNFLNAVHSI